MTTPALELQSFGVAFGKDVVLADVTLQVPERGVLIVTGPGGAGKSTLVRTLAGLNDAQPALKTWGQVWIDGHESPVARRRRRQREAGDERRRLALVIQDARFLTATVRENLVSGLPNRGELIHAQQIEILRSTLARYDVVDLFDRIDDDVMSLPLMRQRQLAIIRASLADPTILCIDESTAGLEAEDASSILWLLRKLAEERAIIFVTHNQAHARVLGGDTALLAGGRIQEIAPTETFFSRPQTPVAQNYVRTGSCSVPSPTARREDLSDAAQPPPPLPAPAAHAAASPYVGPRGFYWLYAGKLGGLPRPGIIADLVDDLAALRRLGVTTLVTLEEVETVSARVCASVGIKHHLFPIVDMKVPSLRDAHNLCAEIARWNADGRVVALHCRAGLGRTGTMLACQLIWDGATARDALEQVREINPRFIQSTQQVEFLDTFATWLDETERATTRHAQPLLAQPGENDHVS